MNTVFRAVSGKLTKFVDCFYAGLLWLICCIPIFTIGASSSALYYTIQKNLKNNRSYTGREFFRCFKENFRQATVLWLGILFFAAASLLGMYLSVCGIVPMFFFFLYLLVFLLLLLVTVCVFPYIARFSGTNTQILKNALLIALTNPGRTVLALLLTAAAVFAVWLIPPLVFFLPTPVMWGINVLLEKTFRKYMSAEELQAEFNRNCTWNH